MAIYDAFMESHLITLDNPFVYSIDLKLMLEFKVTVTPKPYTTRCVNKPNLGFLCRHNIGFMLVTGFSRSEGTG